MKKNCLFILIILLFSSSTFAQTVTLTEQEKRHSKMVKEIKVKLKKYDKDTFEDFAFLGLSYCIDDLLPYPETMNHVYVNSFNFGKALFPRVIALEDLQKELSHFHKQNFKYKRFNGFSDMIDKCQSVYHVKNKNLRKTYLQIINNPNYQENWNFDY